MKKVFITLLFVVSIVTVHAKERDAESKDSNTKGEATMILAGSIADEISGESLVGVEVKIEGTDKKTYTDFDGNFSFEGVKPGDYKLVTNYISYKKKSKELKVDTNKNNIKITLQSSN